MIHCLKSLMLAALVVCIVHATILNNLAQRRTYKTLAYFFFCGLWIWYIAVIFPGGYLQAERTFGITMGSLTIAWIVRFVNRQMEKATENDSDSAPD